MAGGINAPDSAQDSQEFFDALLNFIVSNGVNNNLIGKFKSITVCDSCKFACDKVETFNFIPLHLETTTQDQSLELLMQNFSVSERIPLKEGFRCSQCKEFSSADRTLSIEETGNWLMLALKRFKVTNDRVTKDSSAISYPFSLTVKNKSFSLRGIICHYGEYQGGHYISCINRAGKWFKCDDDKVSCISDVNVLHLKSQVYCLFFQHDC